MRLGLIVLALTGAGPLPAQDRAPAPGAPSLSVLPFTVAGLPPDTAALRESGARAVERLNELLRADSTVRWVERRPMRRARDPRTGQSIAARYAVLGVVRRIQPDSVSVRVDLVSVESVELLFRDSVTVKVGEEASVSESVIRPLLATVRQVERRPRVTAPTGATVPTEAVRIYSRALLYADRGDTTAAVRLLREAISIAAGYREACEALRRMRPAERCE